MFTKITKNAKSSFNTVIEKLQSGNISDIGKLSIIEIPENMPCKKWSTRNKFWAIAQTGTLLNATYNQWRGMGRKVTEKGAAFIFTPIHKKVKDDNGDEVVITVGYSSCPVFSIDKTQQIEDFDGEIVKECTPKTPPPLIDISKKLGIAINYDYYLGYGSLGSCTKDGNIITLRTEDNEVFWHELAHAIDAKIKGGLLGGQDKHQETVAELTACVIADIYGHDITGNAWDYISSYNDDPMKAINAAIDDVTEILDYIFESN